MSLANRSYQTLCLSPIGADAPSGLYNHWVPFEILLGVDHRCVSVYSDLYRSVTFENQDSSKLLHDALTKGKVILTGTKGTN
jgi:hypothetical protein